MSECLKKFYIVTKLWYADGKIFSLVSQPYDSQEKANEELERVKQSMKNYTLPNETYIQLGDV